jgi:hypothetical protein
MPITLQDLINTGRTGLSGIGQLWRRGNVDPYVAAYQQLRQNPNLLNPAYQAGEAMSQLGVHKGAGPLDYSIGPNAASAYKTGTVDVQEQYPPPPTVPGPVAGPATRMATLPPSEDFESSFGGGGGDTDMDGNAVAPSEKAQVDPSRGAEPISARAQATQPAQHDHRMFMERHPNAGRAIGIGSIGAMIGSLLGNGNMAFGAGAAQGLAKGINEQDQFNRQAQEEDLARQSQQEFGMRQLAEQARLHDQSAQADWARGRVPTTYQGQQLMVRPEELLNQGTTNRQLDISQQNADTAAAGVGDRDMRLLAQGMDILQKGKMSPNEAMLAATMPNLKGMFGPSPAEQLLQQRTIQLLMKHGVISADSGGSSAQALDQKLAGMTPDQRIKWLHQQLGETTKMLAGTDPKQRQDIEAVRALIYSKLNRGGQ